MTDFATNYIINPYLAWKAQASINYQQWFIDNNYRMSVPKFNTVFDISDYMKANFAYIADPITFDNYTHPEVAQWAVTNKKFQIDSQHNLSLDCDDYAIWANKALVNSGFDRSQIWIVNLLTPLLQFWDAKFNHVICLLFNYMFQGYPWIAVLDTNGLHWFCQQNTDHTDKDWAREIMDYFGNLYGCTYGYFVKSDYPFKDL